MDSLRVGRSLRALRRRRGWRQSDVADKAGSSQSQVSRIELGQLDAIPLAELSRVATALGAWLDVRVLWNGEGLDRLLDADHASLVEAVVRRLEHAGWEAPVEVSFAIRGERGSIDVLGWHARTRSLVVVEVKSVVPDVGAMLMALDRKVRLAPLVARDRGWHGAGVARLLVLAEARTTRRRVEQHDAVFRRTLPVRGREVDSWLRHPEDPIAGLRFLPLTRRTGGKQRTRVRRHPEPSDSRSIGSGSRRGRPTDPAYHPPRG